MAESTKPGQCTDAEWEAARDAGLLFEVQGTNAFDAAIHKFAEAVRLDAYAEGRKDEAEVSAHGLRDRFAGQAMAAILSNPVIFERYGFTQDMAEEASQAYKAADAMLRARA